MSVCQTILSECTVGHVPIASYHNSETKHVMWQVSYYARYTHAHATLHQRKRVLQSTVVEEKTIIISFSHCQSTNNIVIVVHKIQRSIWLLTVRQRKIPSLLL